jgi:hypothetical protein
MVSSVFHVLQVGYRQFSSIFLGRWKGSKLPTRLDMFIFLETKPLKSV